ncbi:MAG TPA: hypothetical protein VFT22_22025 [Kofleriaceae bacterium]|nr:hypothetical protein [Kofleriaceae bacterium]
MNRTRQLSALGQSLWLDNISRALLDDGTLARYIDECSITGLTSMPADDARTNTVLRHEPVDDPLCLRAAEPSER